MWMGMRSWGCTLGTIQSLPFKQAITRTQVTIDRGGLTVRLLQNCTEDSYMKTCLDLSSGFRDRANRRTWFRSVFGCSHFPPIEYCLSTLIVDHFCQILFKISIHIHSGDLKICHLNEKKSGWIFQKIDMHKEVAWEFKWFEKYLTQLIWDLGNPDENDRRHHLC